MVSFDVLVRGGGDDLTLILQGDLDMAATQTLWNALDALDHQVPSDVVLDLRQLEFLDSTGLRCLIAGQNRLREAGRRLLVVRGPQQVHRVFELTRMDDYFQFVHRNGEATRDRHAQETQ